MQFGVFFPHQLPKPWTPVSEVELFQGALDAVEIADRIGVAYAWAQEHHFLEEYSHSTAPEVFLGACSQRTKHIRLGHGISVSPPAVNHPARIAERIATLDLVSGGRVEWGTGEMSSRIELEGFGVNYVEKRAMWSEAVRETARMLALEPYPGHQGKYFQMPTRNVVPKPMQRPHPPMWVACTNRDTLKFAARLGLGALTFAFMDPGEAKFWVEEYYEIFRTECHPIGLAVNPNVATLIGFHCTRDGDAALEAARRDQQFFKFGLAHYYRTGDHVPGRSAIWEAFEAAESPPMAGLDGVGAPEELAERFAAYEAVGVDQLILLQQAGRASPGDVCRSLELFGEEVIGGFIQRHVDSSARKQAALAPFVDQAMTRVASAPTPDLDPVLAYPKLWDKQSGGEEPRGLHRAVEASSLWNLHVGRRGRQP
jgi:alkanesulfonate monooxygenase SsuD/methylene tetrahydromethanopterin reductase-like flavin-dependent oxidoreductase (luciferase family)